MAAQHRIRVIDKDGFQVGWVLARVGLKTYNGEVTRWTEKSFWTMTQHGERLWRGSDHQPCVYRSYVRASELLPLEETR